MKARQEHNAPRNHGKPREPSIRSQKKQKAKALIDTLAKNCFGRTLKFVNVQLRARKQEYYYKLKISQCVSFDCIIKFNRELSKIVGNNFRLTFNGFINPKTGKSEVILHIVLFKQEDR